MSLTQLHAAARDDHDAPLRFVQARPFRHVLLEPFFTPDFLARLLAEFPGFERGNARNEAGELAGKSVVERVRALGPAFSELDDLIQTPDFLRWLSRVTGIPDLLYDPHYFGGGTHDNRHGQDLDAHIDFNRHPVTGWHRRLNLIVYLNEVWQEPWGGCLELHSDPRSPGDEVVSILPLMNRCVIFETTEWSWHGFPRIDLPAEHAQRSRRSIALYFYTVERPEEERADPHSTVYVDRPLPDWVRAGHTLSEADAQTLRILSTRRDQHIQRLYRDVQSLMAQLDQANRMLRSGRLGRLVQYARHALALLRRRG